MSTKQSQISVGLGVCVLLLAVTVAYLLGRSSQGNNSGTVEYHFLGGESGPPGPQVGIASGGRASPSRGGSSTYSSSLHSGRAAARSEIVLYDNSDGAGNPRTPGLNTEADADLSRGRYYSTASSRLPSEVVIHGTSDISDWTVSSKVIGGYIDVSDDLFHTSASQTSRIPAKAEVSIPVRSLRSGKPAMDRRIIELLDGEAHPAIRFSSDDIVLTNSIEALGTCVVFASGTLSVAGVTNRVSFRVHVREEGGRCVMTGEVPLRMSDYGISDRSDVLGGVRVTAGDHVRLSFNWFVRARQQHD